MDAIKVGVVGCGAIGRDHISRLNRTINGVTVTAVSDVYVEGGKRTAQEAGAVFFENGEEMIASDLVDAVVVTTLDEYHEQYVLAAIKAGKQVFCEKPLAPTAEACKRIMDAEMAAGKRLLQVGFMRRYDKGYLEMKRLIQDRVYGEPLLIHCAHRNGVITDNYVTEMLITNCAVHEIDITHWLLDENHVRVQVVKGKKTRNSLEKLHDPIVVMIETESGVRIDDEVFMNCHYGYDIRCEVVCEEASFSLPTPQSVLVRNEGKRFLTVSDDWKERFITAYDVEFQEWADAIAKGAPVGPSAYDGYICAATANACVKALYSGQIEEVEMLEKPDFYR